MKDINKCSPEQIKILQNEAKQFLTKTRLKFDGLDIQPKEIEVYYYIEGLFEDNSVHRNDLQKNNKNHFYVHRWGTNQDDSYKGGNYPGIDFVVSDDNGIYYSYLIRSAVINDKMIVGPHKVLKAIETASKLNYKDIETKLVETVPTNILSDVLFSCRINLGKKVKEEYRNCKLRAVLCDEWFRNSKYPAKESMIIDKVRMENIPKDVAIVFAQNHLGYIPSSIKNYERQ